MSNDMQARILAFVTDGPRELGEIRARFGRRASANGWIDDDGLLAAVNQALDDLAAAGEIIIDDEPIWSPEGRLTGVFARRAVPPPAPAPQLPPAQRFIAAVAEFEDFRRWGHLRHHGTEAEWQTAIRERQADLDAMPVPSREEAVAEFMAEIQQLGAKFRDPDIDVLIRDELATAEALAVAEARYRYAQAWPRLGMSMQQVARDRDAAQAAHNRAIDRRAGAGFRRDAIVQYLIAEYGNRGPGRAEAGARADRIFGERWENDRARGMLAQFGLTAWPFAKTEQ